MRKNKGKIKFKNKNLTHKNLKAKPKKIKNTSPNPKSKLRIFLSHCSTVLIALILVFLGYSAVGPAIVRLSGGGDYDSENPSYQTDSAGEILSDGNSGSAFTIENLSSFESEIEGLNPDEYDSVIVPLKQKGGIVCYKTGFEPAYVAGAVVSDDSMQDAEGSMQGAGDDIKTVADRIREKGFKPIAMLNVLDDEIYPLTFGDTQYLASGDMDSSGEVENGINSGSSSRLYLNPNSAGTVSYIKALSLEIQNAGFEKIVYTDVYLPEFTESEIDEFVRNVTDSLRIEFEVE